MIGISLFRCLGICVGRSTFSAFFCVFSLSSFQLGSGRATSERHGHHSGNRELVQAVRLLAQEVRLPQCQVRQPHTNIAFCHSSFALRLSSLFSSSLSLLITFVQSCMCACVFTVFHSLLHVCACACVCVRMIIAWLADERVLEDCFSAKRGHPELMKRSSDIFKLLCTEKCLQNSQLDLLWGAVEVSAELFDEVER